MKRSVCLLHVFLFGVVVLGLATPASAVEFAEARIYIEFNSTDNDLGFHVVLDGKNWKSLKIIHPNGTNVFDVQGGGGYREFGMTELFFEGAEPSLDDVPLATLLARFPEGEYTFMAEAVDGDTLMTRARLSHAVPAGPSVSARVDDDEVTIRWRQVTSPPPGFPNRMIRITGYQVIVGSFQVTLPASSRQVTLPEEFVRTLAKGEHDFEVLAIDRSRNQTITSGSFTIEKDGGGND